MAKYSETLTDHVMAPRNSGVLESPDLAGHAGTLGRGPFMVVFLKLEQDRIVAAKYQTYGCGPTISSGSMLTEMIVGRTIAECLEFTVENLIEALDGVPPDELHCPALAIGCSEMPCRGGQQTSARQRGSLDWCFIRRFRE